jgi:hypothetical protein
MKINARLVLEDLIAEGIRLGHSRAYKHNEKPTESEITEYIEQAIWNKLDQYLNFEADF